MSEKRFTHMNIGELKLKFIVKWNCSEEELLEKCRSCETSSELKDVLYENMILNIKGDNHE